MEFNKSTKHSTGPLEMEHLPKARPLHQHRLMLKKVGIHPFPWDKSKSDIQNRAYFRPRGHCDQSAYLTDKIRPEVLL